MGRYWALWLLSLIFRGLGIVSFVLTLVFSCLTIAIPIVGVLWFVYGIVSSLTIYGFGQFILLMLSLQDSSQRTSSIVGVRARRPTPRPDSSVHGVWADDPPSSTQDWVRAPAQRNNTPAPSVPKDTPFRPPTRTAAQQASIVQREMNLRRTVQQSPPKRRGQIIDGDD